MFVMYFEPPKSIVWETNLLPSISPSLRGNVTVTDVKETDELQTYVAAAATEPNGLVVTTPQNWKTSRMF